MAGETVFAVQQHPDGTLFVVGAIIGYLCPLLVDTGSAVTLVSEWFTAVEMGLNTENFTVDSPHPALSGPSGEQLTVVGPFVAHLVIGAAECHHPVLVARGLQYDCLDGSDLLSTILCSIVSDGNGHLTFVSTPTRVSTSNLFVRTSRSSSLYRYPLDPSRSSLAASQGWIGPCSSGCSCQSGVLLEPLLAG